MAHQKEAIGFHQTNSHRHAQLQGAKSVALANVETPLEKVEATREGGFLYECSMVFKLSVVFLVDGQSRSAIV
jgi:hypothetical protein